MKAVCVSTALALLGLIIALAVTAQGPPTSPTPRSAQVDFADVTLSPGQTIIVLRDPKGADLLVVTTFYWQDLKEIPRPVLRSVTSVVPAAKDVPVGTDGSPDPKRVEAVHLSLVRITDRMEWKPVIPTAPTPVPHPPVQ